MPDFSFEDGLGGVIAGVDEAGRGPWAGPVVAAAAVIRRDVLPPELAARLDDSKKLSKKVRDELFERLPGYAHVGIGIAGVAEIDRHNILAATMIAMQRAVEELAIPVDAALIDGNRTPELPCPATAIVKGDQRSISIAAASIAAKVTRDRMMAELAEKHPGYGWERNAGYGTAEHKDALSRLGVTREHRRSFKPIASLLK